MVIKGICSVHVSVKEMHTVGLARSLKVLAQNRAQLEELDEYRRST